MSRRLTPEELAAITRQNRLNDEMVERYDEDSEVDCALSPLTIASMGVDYVNVLLAEVERLQGEAKRALEVVAGEPVEQLQYLHDRGLQAPRVGHSEATSQQPRAYHLEGTWEWQARWVYPGRERLVAAVVAAALMELREKGEKL